jgi:hypothetical protein
MEGEALLSLVSGEDICEGCLAAHAFECPGCGEYYAFSDQHFGSSQFDPVCESCFQETASWGRDDE